MFDIRLVWPITSPLFRPPHWSQRMQGIGCWTKDLACDCFRKGFDSQKCLIYAQDGKVWNFVHSHWALPKFRFPRFTHVGIMSYCAKYASAFYIRGLLLLQILFWYYWCGLCIFQRQPSFKHRTMVVETNHPKFMFLLHPPIPCIIPISKA